MFLGRLSYLEGLTKDGKITLDQINSSWTETTSGSFWVIAISIGTDVLLDVFK